jgi:hypothetical protein
MLKHNPSKGRKLADLCMLLLCSTAVYADTVYRCGESYSTSSQCGNSVATEVKPTSRLATGASTSTSAHDLRDAQALEKQRLQGQRQAAQPVPIQINPPLVQTPVAASHESAAHSGKRQHPHRPASPYFTAVDPQAKQKKKSTAKAVPANAASNP